MKTPLAEQRSHAVGVLPAASQTHSASQLEHVTAGLVAADGGYAIYVQSYNLLNHTNALNFSGVLTSPFFGQPTSAAPPRRIELGIRFRF